MENKENLVAQDVKEYMGQEVIEGQGIMSENVMELEEKLCKEHVPSGFNVYKWAKENGDKSISACIQRLERIFDQADEVMWGCSGGKDSTLSGEFAILELKRRWARVEAGINRYGESVVDPLDLKWVGKRIIANSMDSEWIWSDATSHIYEFVRRHGELGDKTVNMFYKCLQLGWQSGVSFSESRLTSWDPEHKDMWIRPMPTKDELGCDIITNDNIKMANLVRFDDLAPEWQAAREADGSVVEVEGVKMVPNYGLGNHDLKIKGYEKVPMTCWTFSNQDEDNEQDTFSQWVAESVPAGTQIYNLVSLRAAESFDRFTILKQSDYATGEYAKHILK